MQKDVATSSAMSVLENQSNVTIENIVGLFPQYQNFTLLSQDENNVVYKATETTSNRDVAIKILNEGDSTNEGYSVFFGEKNAALIGVQNKSVASVYDYGHVEGCLYVSMEYIHGKPLHRSIYGNTIDTITASKIANDICLGLEAAYAKGVIHGNVTPHNIVLNPEAQPKLINFTHSLDLNENSAGYIAPEVIEDSEAASHLSDVYSVGIILKQMLTGTVGPDFTKNSDGEEIVVEVPEELQAVIYKATAHSPKDRYSSTSTMSLMLREAIEDYENSAESGLKTAPPAHATTAKKEVAVFASAPPSLQGARHNAQLNTFNHSTLNKPAKSSTGLYAALLFVVLGVATFGIFVSKNAGSKEVASTSDSSVELKVDNPLDQALAGHSGADDIDEGPVKMTLFGNVQESDVEPSVNPVPESKPSVEPKELIKPKEPVVIANNIPKRRPKPRKKPGKSTLFGTTGSTDSAAASETSTVAAPFSTANGERHAIIAKKSKWFFDDKGKDYGASDIVKGSADYGSNNWKHSEFDDRSWNSGRGLFGFGSIHKEKPNTKVGEKSASGANVLTSYFRNRFVMTNTHNLINVSASLLVDDAAVIYVNGQEVYRYNLRDGVIKHSDRALKAITSRYESEYTSFEIDPAYFVDGYNVIAVEVHQSNVTSSDLGFDMEVSASRVAE